MGFISDIIMRSNVIGQDCFIDSAACAFVSRSGRPKNIDTPIVLADILPSIRWSISASYLASANDTIVT